MSTTTRVWVNGDLVDPTGPSVSALDHSVTVGDGVFETAKIAAGQPFALTRHHRRLERSAAGLGLPAPDLAVVDKGVAAVLDGPSRSTSAGCATASPAASGRWDPTGTTRRSPTSWSRRRSRARPRAGSSPSSRGRATSARPSSA